MHHKYIVSFLVFIPVVVYYCFYLFIYWVKKSGAVRGSLGCKQTERCPAARPECLCLPPSLPCSSKPAARVPGHPTDQRETDQRAEENVWSKCWISEKRMGEEGKEGLKRLRFPQARPSSSRSFERSTHLLSSEISQSRLSTRKNPKNPSSLSAQ